MWFARFNQFGLSFDWQFCCMIMGYFSADFIGGQRRRRRRRTVCMNLRESRISEDAYPSILDLEGSSKTDWDALTDESKPTQLRSKNNPAVRWLKKRRGKNQGTGKSTLWHIVTHQPPRSYTFVVCDGNPIQKLSEQKHS